MRNIDDILADMMVTHQIDLMRFTAGERTRVIGLLNEMQGELTGIVNSSATAFTKDRARRLIKQADGVIQDYYGRVETAVDLKGLAEHEAAVTASTFASIGLPVALPSQTKLKSLVNGLLIDGSPAAAWWSKQASDTKFKFAQQVRLGIAEGETVQQIARRIRGGAGVPGIMDISRRHAASLVHNAVMTVANKSRMETYRENADVVKGIEQISTLDGHTTPVCIAYSGAQFDLDGNPMNGTTLPYEGGTPRHWGCRSVEVPVTLTWRELGVDIDEFKASTRAAAGGPVRSDMTMDEYLKRQEPRQVDEQLGKGRAQLWRDGKITLRQLVDGNGRELTLEQLRKRAA